MTFNKRSLALITLSTLSLSLISCLSSEESKATETGTAIITTIKSEDVQGTSCTLYKGPNSDAFKKEMEQSAAQDSTVEITITTSCPSTDLIGICKNANFDQDILSGEKFDIYMYLPTTAEVQKMNSVQKNALKEASSPQLEELCEDPEGDLQGTWSR
jgi:hypothetical protein